jgi:hypothetical protein
MSDWLKSRAGAYISGQTKANLVSWREKLSEFTKDIFSDHESDEDEELKEKGEAEESHR